MTGYELSRDWFDWAFENPDLVSPGHTAIYFFAIEHCNRLGWKEKFGFPTQMAMDAIGIKKHETFIRYFSDLVNWGFIKLVQKSTNQYSANIISLSSAVPKNGKALENAIQKHRGKQSESTGESIGSIDKPITIQKTLNNTIEQRKENFAASLKPFLEKYGKEVLNDFYQYWTESKPDGKKFRAEDEKYFDFGKRLGTWTKNEKRFSGPAAKFSNQPQPNGTSQARQLLLDLEKEKQEILNRLNNGITQTDTIEIGHESAE